MTDDRDETPLPFPLAHHVADPTRAVAAVEPEPLEPLEPPTDADRKLPLHVSDEDRDLAEELPTRQLPKLDSGDFAKIAGPPPTVEVERVELPISDGVPPPLPPPETEPEPESETEDELTSPRELPRGLFQRGPRPPEEGPLFVVLPADARAAALARFVRRAVSTGVIVIRQGETAHALIVVARGRLAIRTERADGQIVTLGYVRDGEFIGEGSLLARTPSPVQVVATETSELLALAPKDAYDLAGAFPAVWAELKDVAERRARDWDARLARR